MRSEISTHHKFWKLIILILCDFVQFWSDFEIWVFFMESNWKHDEEISHQRYFQNFSSLIKDLILYHYFDAKLKISSIDLSMKIPKFIVKQLNSEKLTFWSYIDIFILYPNFDKTIKKITFLFVFTWTQIYNPPIFT